MIKFNKGQMKKKLEETLSFLESVENEETVVNMERKMSKDEKNT